MTAEKFVSLFDLRAEGEGVNPTELRQVKEELLEIRNAAKRHLDEGVPPAEFDAASGLLAAANEAESLVEAMFK
jgi:hypothetical protein